MKQVLLPFQAIETEPQNTTKPVQRQQKLTEVTSILQSNDKLSLDELAALVIYADGRPFSLFESSYMRAFLKALNPAYQPPSRNRMAHNLLDESYASCKIDVDAYLQAERNLNIIFDETTAIGGRRVINLIAGTDRGPFFYRLLTLSNGEAATAENLYKYIKPVLHELCDGDYSRINSFSTDTCATMRKWWRDAHAIPELSHCLFIPCDSHSLQLLIKDIVELPRFKATMRLAGRVIQFFNDSGKRYETLRVHQLQLNGRHSALASSVITRWGTQYRMLKSLQVNYLALQAFVEASNYEVSSKEWLRPTIRDSNFWQTISLVLRLISPIHEAQIMSESDHSSLMKVKQRWDDIQSHLQATLDLIDDESVDSDLILRTFYLRKQTQLSDDHYLAHYLVPTNVIKPLSDYDKAKVMASLKSLTGDSYIGVKTEFFDYRNRRGVYGAGRDCWKLTSSPIHFWDDCESERESSLLPHLARRLASTIANSVPSERAFSTMNLIHSKLRNRLLPDRVEKQIYIHINRRILDSPLRRIDQLTESDWIDIELNREEEDIQNGEKEPDEDEPTGFHTQQISQPNFDLLQPSQPQLNSSHKRRNSAIQEARSRPDFQSANLPMHQNAPLAATPQGNITVVNSYNHYGLPLGQPSQTGLLGTDNGPWSVRLPPLHMPSLVRPDLVQHGSFGGANSEDRSN